MEMTPTQRLLSDWILKYHILIEEYSGNKLKEYERAIGEAKNWAHTCNIEWDDKIIPGVVQYRYDKLVKEQ